MKVVIFLLFISISVERAYSQVDYIHAFGIRAGNPLGLSYKYFYGDYSAIEGIAGYTFTDGYSINTLYLAHFYLNYVSKVYLGAGVAAAYQPKSILNFGPTAIAGFEYNLPILPINFSLDWKPVYYLHKDNRRFKANEFALSVRYLLFR